MNGEMSCIHIKLADLDMRIKSLTSPSYIDATHAEPVNFSPPAEVKHRQSDDASSLV